MAKKTKESEPLFTQAEFNNAQYAADIKADCEKKLNRIKLGLKIAAAAELFYFLGMFIPKMPQTLVSLFMILAFLSTFAAYIIGGGFGSAVKMAWKVAKKIATFGWLIVPFPADIITGFICLWVAIIVPIFAFILIPLLLIFINYTQVKKDLDAAEEYLKYCE